MKNDNRIIKFTSKKTYLEDKYKEEQNIHTEDGFLLRISVYPALKIKAFLDSYPILRLKIIIKNSKHLR